MVIEYFKQLGTGHKLVKALFTGVVASLIDRKTMHVLCRISWGEAKITNEAKAKLEVKWSCREYLILDEYSMLSKTMLLKILKHIGLRKILPSKLFGRISVILCGDHHQFPLVACPISETLYWPPNPAHNKVHIVVGGELFQSFKDIVVLWEQIHITDLR